MGWSEDSDPRGRLVGKVREVVDRVLEDYRDDPAVFADLLGDFRRFKNRLRRRADLAARRESEAMAGRERL